MTLILQTGVSIESLNVSLTVVKATLADAVLRAKQAEEMVGVLMAKSMSEEMQRDLFTKVAAHIDQRSSVAATQARAVIEAAALSLTTTIKALKAHEATLGAEDQAVNKVHEGGSLAKALHTLMHLQADLERFLNPTSPQEQHST